MTQYDLHAYVSPYVALCSKAASAGGVGAAYVKDQCLSSVVQLAVGQNQSLPVLMRS